MSMRSDVINFVQNHPGKTTAIIATSLTQHARDVVTSQLSKLALEGVIIRVSNGVHNVYYMPEPQSREAMKHVDLAESLEARKLWNRAAGAWLDAMLAANNEREAARYSRHRARAIRYANERNKSGDSWYLSGNYVGAK